MRAASDRGESEPALKFRAEALHRFSNPALDSLQRAQNGQPIREHYESVTVDLQVDIRAIDTDAREYFARATFKAAGWAALLNALGIHVAGHGAEVPVLIWVGNLTQGFQPLWI